LPPALTPHVEGSGCGIKQQARQPRSDRANLRWRRGRPNYRIDQSSGVRLAAALYMFCALFLHLL